MLRKSTLLLLLTIIVASCGTRKATVSSAKIGDSQQGIIDFGKNYLGKPYRYAGRGPHAFDCSGFTSFVFGKFGYKLNPSSSGQDRQVPSIRRKEDLRVGDLVFFEGRTHNGNVGHVGIVTEVRPNGKFTFIHASTNQGVVLSSSAEEYYASRYLRGGRILRDNLLETTEHKTQSLTDNKPQAIKKAKQKSLSLEKKEIEVVVVKGKQLESSIVIETDTIVTHARQAKTPLKTPTPKKKEQGSIFTSHSMILPDTISVPAPTETSMRLIHTVTTGETLFAISQKYGCTVTQLQEWNPALREVLRTGDKLLVKQFDTQKLF